ncbi:hypothetical protein F5H01DRAFT_351259 [Linnemannia elongata]|nr:hypothetical protein F5H01DRAFT_351259 [Linnemannia elongata]
MFSLRKVFVLAVMVATIAFLGLFNSNHNSLAIVMAAPAPAPVPASIATIDGGGAGLVGVFEKRTVCDDEQCFDDCVEDKDVVYHGGYCYQSVCQCVLLD